MTTILQATVHDLDRIVPLFDAYRQFYGRNSEPGLVRRFLEERFAHHESIILLACSESGSAEGFVQLYPIFSSVRLVRTYILNDLFVAPEARRSGVARRLLAE